MKIMLDCSPRKLEIQRKKYSHDFWQLRTPLTRNKIAGCPYGLDNGCFNRFDEKTWLRLVDEAYDPIKRPVFVTLPDIVGDARRTLDLFSCFEHKTAGLPRALVLQDGIGNYEIPWDSIDAVFVGGSDEFKVSTEAINACRVAKMLHKWIHVGRVNTIKRAQNWLDLADSIDGSGISKYDYMLEAVLRVIEDNVEQATLDIDNQP